MSQRERFEAWAAKQLTEDGLPYFLVKLPDGGYIDRDTKHAWQAWQAACPEGWQAVPIEPTGAMKEAALDAYTPYGSIRAAIQAAVAHAPKLGGV